LTIQTRKQHIEEGRLIELLKSKDKEAFTYLYDNYSGALYGVVNRIVKEEDIAEEVLHDAFLKIWEKIELYEPSKGRLFTWMMNLTRNLSIDKTRSKEFNKSKKTSDIADLVGREKDHNHTEQSTDSIGLSTVLKDLNQDQYFVVDHLYFKGYTQSELADEFDIPLGTVKTRLRQAMIILRKSLGVK
jgi:RNA polymerase sigma factor (sigma-70 family)